MFTGIVEEVGQVESCSTIDGGTRIRITCGSTLDDVSIDDSIAVNGCCLTVIDRGERWWEADVMLETLNTTTLGTLAHGDLANLERPMRLGSRLDGHLVQGHIDGTAEVVEVREEADGSRRLTLEIPSHLARYTVERGSITLDGVSLTIAARNGTRCEVSLIPHTQSVTTLGGRRVGDRLNVEVDVLAKYVESLLHPQEDS